MASSRGAEQSAEESVTLLVRSPTLEDDLRVAVPLSSTVLTIKQALARKHPEIPQPDEQRLIFAGQLLKDEVSTASILSKVRVCTLLPPPRSRPLPAHAAHQLSARCCLRSATSRSRMSST